MNPTLETLVNLRGKVQEVFDEFAALAAAYKRPDVLNPDQRAELRQAADAVRQTRQAVRKAEQVVAEQRAATQALPFNATDSELIAANAKLRERKEMLEMAMQRLQAAVAAQDNLWPRIHRAAEQMLQQRRDYAQGIADECGRRSILDADKADVPTLGKLVEKLYGELDRFCSLHRNEIIYSRNDEIGHEIGGILERVAKSEIAVQE